MASNSSAQASTAAGSPPARAAASVTGVAVASLAGVAGMVWKESERFYLRVVPLAQNGSTIKLGLGTHEGWERRPFLLLDSFVDARDEGNHVLLEPDHSSPAYHVRPVILDSHDGALSWDPSSSLGTFTLPVSAAALNSSGMVVALNTDSGRLGVLEPARTPRPTLATYAAGQGSEIGLLPSPSALAITNPGVVLVLEAGLATAPPTHTWASPNPPYPASTPPNTNDACFRRHWPEPESYPNRGWRPRRRTDQVLPAGSGPGCALGWCVRSRL
jgi:hypothetical protein